MLKNFITTLVIVGTLWSTPISFVFQGGTISGTQENIARAQLLPPASTRPTTVPTNAPTEGDFIKDLSCNIFKGWKGIQDCVAMLGYGLFYVPTSWVLIAAGGVFDALLAFSLSPTLLNQGYVKTTWGAIRDMANLVFILILLWIALATILNIGGVQLKQAVANVVIIALLINFSYFFTRVVIDASNIVAFEFYTAAGAGTSRGNHVKNVTEYRVSEAITNGIAPQKLLSKQVFDEWKKKNDSGNSVLFFIFLLGGIINLFAAYVLFYAGFLMLGRVIAFVFLIIASPIAFIAYALPKGGGFTSSWWNQLLNQAMVAPVFLFFLYIIIKLAAGTATFF